MFSPPMTKGISLGPILRSECCDLGKLTPDNDVLESASDCAVTVLVERGFVTSLQPSDTFGIGDKGLGCLLWVVPVTLGELIPCHIEFTSLSNRNNVALGINNLGPGVRQNLSDRGKSGVDTVGGEGIEAGRGRLGETFCCISFEGTRAYRENDRELTIAASVLGHVQVLEQALH